jgi:hypothetical protein
MKSLEGIVTVVQEGRFLLETDQGDSHLFVLSHSAPLEPAQLAPLQHRQARVRVSYTPGPHIVGMVAHQVRVLADHPVGSAR